MGLDIRINLPWEGAVSFHGRWENFKFNLDWSYYLRGLSLKYTVSDCFEAYVTEQFPEAFVADAAPVGEAAGVSAQHAQPVVPAVVEPDRRDAHVEPQHL